MTLLGTTLRPVITRVMLLGSGELGKKVAIECQHLGVEVIAVDRYADASVMHVAYRSHVISMFDGDTLCRVAELEKPHYIVPEIGAITTDTLIQLEEEGPNVVPCARATKLMMNREGIRRLAAEELQLSASTYRFADSGSLSREAVVDISYPCIVKPVMSSSGKGQMFIRSAEQLTQAWKYARQSGRAGAGRVTVEGVVEFDFETTLLIVNAVDGVHFRAPVDRRQEDGDYRESWQPQQVSPLVLECVQEIARRVVLVPGGYGSFGIELFVRGDEVIFSGVSSRSYDTGMATLISQDLSEFALHVRAFLGLPVGGICQYGLATSAVILPRLTSQNVMFDNVQNAVGVDLQIRLLGKPEVDGSCRPGVALATVESIVNVVERAKHAAGQVKVQD